MRNYEILRMETLSVERNSMKDDVREAKIFRADKVQERLSPLQSVDVPSAEELRGAKDAEPSVLSFYNGRTFSEGRKLHNAYLVANGRPPLSEGQK